MHPSPQHCTWDLLARLLSSHASSRANLPASVLHLSDDLGILDCSEDEGVCLSPEQVDEALELLAEARLNREFRVPQLEASLAEANELISQCAGEYSALLQEHLLASQPTSIPNPNEDDVPVLPLDLETESGDDCKVNKQPTMATVASPETDTNPDAFPLDHIMVELATQLSRLEIENKRMKETLERYEVAVAMYKGDRHMLLTDALRAAFTSPNYRLLVGKTKTEVLPEQHTGIETDLVEVPVKEIEISPPDSVAMPIDLMTMMQGCWMYKYPRRRFHKLIGSPNIPLEKLTYRFFWFCPANKAIIWTEKAGLFRKSTCKLGTPCIKCT